MSSNRRKAAAAAATSMMDGMNDVGRARKKLLKGRKPSHAAKFMKLSKNFRITSHSQMKFERLMAIENLSLKQIIASLDVMANRNKVFNAGEGAGASGSFFFFSADHRFLIKTLQGTERDVITKMLDDYIGHIEESTHRRKSLLARIYGIFSIHTSQFGTLDVMIMENTARMRDADNRLYQFDLKGSSVKRYTQFNTFDFLKYSESWHAEAAEVFDMANFGESATDFEPRRRKSFVPSFGRRSTSRRGSAVRTTTNLFHTPADMPRDAPMQDGLVPKFVSKTVMKDKNLWMMDDFLKASSANKALIRLPFEVKEELDELLKYDSMFLRRNAIMDYSAYVVVERVTGFQPGETRHEFVSLQGGELYHVSVIDYLQMWNRRKRGERWLKKLSERNSEGLSCIEPKKYSERFISSMSSQVFHTDVQKRGMSRDASMLRQM
jgi:hypothetical protein